MNHYEWLEKWLPTIASNLGIKESLLGAIVAEGDKCYSKEDTWKALGIPFPHGVAMYILSKTFPWSKEVRNTPDGWVDPCRKLNRLDIKV